MGSDTVTIEEIDRRLAEWKRKLSLVGNNVMALTEDPTFKRLSLHQADLQGRTREVVAPALAAMSDLWQNFALLGDVIDNAAALRKNMPKLIGVQERLHEIDRLLTGPSIKLAPTHTPLAARGLLTPAEVTESLTPDRLLAAMTAAFETARQVVVEVTAAWEYLQTCLTSEPMLAAQRARIESDPLGCRPLIDEEMSRLRDIAACRQTAQDLIALHARAEAAWTRCVEVIDQPPVVPRPDAALLPNLLQRLDNMQTHLADGTWSATQVGKGLETWHAQSTALRDAEQKAAETWEALLAEREELRGRLAVYKARALKKGVVEDAVLIQVGNQADAHLHAPHKTPLKAARALVDQYRQRITELSGG